ncbi:site-specific integrase [Sphingosinicellaceae bacterium]|nr:site-specific integrase [Sphingosinicellaceae bacterium]
MESVRVDALFAETASGRENSTAIEITDAALENLARRYLHQLEVASHPMPFNDAERRQRGHAAEDNAADVGRSTEDAGLQQVAVKLGRDAGLAVDTRTPEFFRLIEAVQRSLIEHYRRERDRAALKAEKAYDPLFAAVSSSAPPPIAKLSMAKAVEMYVASPERLGAATKTKAAYRFRFSVLVELIGAEKPVGEITRGDVRDVRDILLRLPPNARKRFPCKSLRTVVENASTTGVAPMSAKSAKLYLECLSSLFRWLNVEELAPKNPALGIKGPSLPDTVNRRSFTVSELNLMFASAPFNATDTQGWLFWLPRIALFTGARFAELLGLKVADIIIVDGINALDIVPNEVRGLKNKVSRRIVPIHPALADIGFLTYVRSLPRDGLLFPEAAGPANMVTARNKQVGLALRKLIPDRAIVFHSLRHTFKDAAMNSNISRDMVAALGGWELRGGRGAMDDYGRDRLARVLAAEVAKLKFDGVILI